MLCIWIVWSVSSFCIQFYVVVFLSSLLSVILAYSFWLPEAFLPLPLARKAHFNSAVYFPWLCASGIPRQEDEREGKKSSAGILETFHLTRDNSSLPQSFRYILGCSCYCCCSRVAWELGLERKEKQSKQIERNRVFPPVGPTLSLPQRNDREGICWSPFCLYRVHSSGYWTAFDPG